MIVGTKVICVDDSKRPEVAEWAIKHCPNWVKKGEKYTIRLFDSHDDIVDGVLLEEVVNQPVFLVKWNTVIEPRFATWRFRELEEHELEEDESTEEEVGILEALEILN
jgi:hypothetical protein